MNGVRDTALSIQTPLPTKSSGCSHCQQSQVNVFCQNAHQVMTQNGVFQNFIFMGDFNAGCSYVPKKAWKNIRLRTDPKFVWLIGDREDTTVKKSTSCAYDR